MNKLEQAARALLAKWDAHPYTPWREVGFISGDVANLREALAEQENPLYRKVLREMLDAHEQAEQGQEPLVRFCPGCGSVGEVDNKYHNCCPDGGKARMIPKELAEHCHRLFELAIVGAAHVEPAQHEPVMIAPGGGAFPFAVVGEFEQAEHTPYCKQAPMCKTPCGNSDCVEQAEQEPLIWGDDKFAPHERPQKRELVGYWQGKFSQDGGAVLYEVPQASAFGYHYQNYPVYASPVRTKDLSDDEIAEAVGSPLDEVYLADFRAVIAADREKNK